MRKHDVRKWLHAILDLLPVILIPVFMIYSHRHEINDGSIQVQEKIAVDFNQIYTPNESQIYTIQNSYSIEIDNSLTGFITLQDFTLNDSHIYLYNAKSSVSTWRMTAQGSFGYISPNALYDGNQVLITNASGGRINITNNQLTTEGTSLINISVYDLTQMFGSGNEPSIVEFNSYFSSKFYPYTLSYKELIDGDLVTYNDTDIMSQFTYQLYNSVDKYFNMGNVFHLNEVYDWFNLNIFNGQAPIYIFIVYQIVLYELIMDLLMLLYALFMWFIDMIEKLMEKPLNSIK